MADDERGGGTGGPAPDVFISYKRTDRPKIAALEAALRRLGLDVWFDASLRTGVVFDDVLEAKARACRAMVVCWTSACFEDRDSGYVRWEAGIGRERGVLVPAALEPPAGIRFEDGFDMLQTEDLSRWLTTPAARPGEDPLGQVGEHGPLSDPAFLRLLDRLGELLDRQGLAGLAGVYAAFGEAGEPVYTRPRLALEAAVEAGRDWLALFGRDVGAEMLARELVDYEYAALGARVSQDYGRLLGQWTPPGAEATLRERGLVYQLGLLQRRLDAKDAHIEQLKASLERLRRADEERTKAHARASAAEAAALADAAEQAAAEQARARLREAEEEAARARRAAREQEAAERSGPSIARPGAVWRDAIPGLPADAAPEMVTLPPGSFLMGSPGSEERWKGYDGREEPRHEVTIGRAVALGRHAVTFAQWDAARAAGASLPNPGDSGWGRDRRPVIYVSWDDVQRYVGWLNERLGLEGRADAYRLPSEAEWEHACRAGTDTPFSFGETISTDQANYDGNYTYGRGRKGESRGRTTPVGSFPANAFGLHDMHGGVWEWCEDLWHDTYDGAPADGSAWTTGGDGSRRVLRGGFWGSYPHYVRSAFRAGSTPAYRGWDVGFRLARTMPER